MVVCILSHFNHRYGPQVIISVPQLPPSIDLDDNIPCLMDLYKEGFFIHESGGVTTANLIFDVYSRLARGRREILMLSILTFEGKYPLSLSSFKEIMELFVSKFKSMANLYMGLHHKDIKDADTNYNDIISLMKTFSNALPDERAIYKQNMSKILTYGLSPLGKSTIINSLKEKFSNLKETTRDLLRSQSLPY